MPVHDWTRVEAGIFHDFHNSWTIHIKEALNEGVLPTGYYALAEQHSNEVISDVLTLHAPSDEMHRGNGKGAVAVLDTPPKVSRKVVGLLRPPKKFSQRRVSVRHVSNHRVVALIEIVSPANKDRPASIRAFTEKVHASLELNINFLIVDLYPPGKHDPHGMHAAIWKTLGRDKEMPPANKPLCLMSYVAKMPPEAYLEWIGVGAKAALPAMPLFLDPKHYINVPLDATYQAAYRGVPQYWREVIEKVSAARKKS